MAVTASRSMTIADGARIDAPGASLSLDAGREGELDVAGVVNVAARGEMDLGGRVTALGRIIHLTGTALVPDTLTDLGGGACFNDARVQVALLPVA